MALTRKMLKAMGIEEEKIEQIIEAHAESTDALKKERDTYRADAEKLVDIQKELDKANEKIAKNGDIEMISKSEYDAIVKEYNDFKSDIDAKNTHAAKEHAFRDLLKEAGIGEKRLNAIIKVSDINGFELDENQKIKDAARHMESIKTEWSDFIETTMERGANTATPPANNGRKNSKTKEEILAIKDGTLRRQEIANNPHLFGIEN